MKAPIPDKILRLMKPEDRAPMGKAGKTLQEIEVANDAWSERELQEQIAGHLRRNEVEFIRPDMRKKSPLPEGWPDFTFALKGQAVALECKAGRGELSAEQNRRIAKMRAGLNQWHVRVIRSYTEYLEAFNQLAA